MHLANAKLAARVEHPGLGKFRAWTEIIARPLHRRHGLRGGKVAEFAQAPMVMLVRQIIQLSLLLRLLAVSNAVLEVDGGEDHVAHDELRHGRLEAGVVVDICQLAGGGVSGQVRGREEGFVRGGGGKERETETYKSEERWLMKDGQEGGDHEKVPLGIGESILPGRQLDVLQRRVDVGHGLQEGHDGFVIEGRLRVRAGRRLIDVGRVEGRDVDGGAEDGEGGALDRAGAEHCRS